MSAGPHLHFGLVGTLLARTRGSRVLKLRYLRRMARNATFLIAGPVYDGLHFQVDRNQLRANVSCITWYRSPSFFVKRL